MALLHRSSDTPTDEPVTDVMASNADVTASNAVVTASNNAVVTPTQEVPTRVTEYTGERVVEQDIRVPRASATIAMGAFVALLLSAWAGIIPFIGPTFGFSADGTSSWTWNDAHTYGALVPGAVAFVACLMILACARRPAGMQSAGTLASSGAVVFLCGAWLAVFPVAWAVIRVAYFQTASPTLTLEYWLGYAVGPGVLLAAFGAFVMGRARIERVAHRLVNRLSVA